MNKVYLIRHAATAGNAEKRYIGTTDEPLSADGKARLAGRAVPDADIVAVSPLLRCIESAAILYPDARPQIVADFCECDFGEFEGKNYKELSGNAAYQAWIDSGGVLPFPGGESPQTFRNRCASAFLRFMNEIPAGKSVAIVAHGGTVMSVLSAFAQPKRDFYDWQIENGQGYAAVWEGGKLTVEGKLWQ